MLKAGGGRHMNRRKFLILSLILIFLPMPFVWYGYGPKGYIGLIALENMFFVGGWLLLLFANAFQGRWNLYLKRFGALMVLFSYFWGALDFCGHIGGRLNPLTVCKFPMWISFIGASGIIVYVYFLTEQNKKAELR